MMETIKQEQVIEQIHTGLRHLTAMDYDHAEQANGLGFSKVDTWVGQELASQESLSLAELNFSFSIVRKYRKQLKNAGYDLPTAEQVNQYIGENKVKEYTRVSFRQEKIEEQREARKAEQKKANPDKVSIEHGRILVQFGFDRAKVEAIQPLKKSVKDWAFNRYGKKEWSFPKTATEQVLKAIQQFDDFEYAPEIEAFRLEAVAEAELVRQQEELAARAREAEKRVTLQQAQPYLDGEPLPSGRTLFVHQQEAVSLLLDREQMILAHDMGLGKSCSSLVAAKAYDLPVIIICPATLKINWLREAESVGLPVEVYSWAKIPPPPETNYVLIGDECHYAQNLKSQRTQAFLELAKNARAVYCLTGTPLKNGRPANLLPLLIACKHELAKNRKAFEIRYCDAHKKVVNRMGTEVWDVTGASHLDELHQKTKNVILYKKKEDCIDLPEKVRVMRTAEVSADATRAYNDFIKAMRAAHKGSVDVKLAVHESAMKAYKASVEAGDDVEEPEKYDPTSADAIVELGMLIHASSLAKVESAVELAQEVLEQNQQVVLFTRFVNTAEQIANALGGSVLRGGLSDEQKQELIDSFQAGRSKVLVCTFGAGGVGITLTAAQTVILVDRPWTPGDAKQAEDRLHRIGQKNSVTAIWLQYGAIDEKIDTILEEKQDRIDLVLEGKRKTMRGVSKSVASMAKEIMREIYNS